MLINHPKKVICVSVPKTGSTSLHYALMSSLPGKFETKSKLPSIYHLNAEDIMKIMGPFKFRDYFSFGVVRSPYDRMVSLYHDFKDQRGLIKSDSFEDFVLQEFRSKWIRDIHFLKQSYFLTLNGEIIVSEVYKYEAKLELVYNTIVDKLGLEMKNISHARKSDRGGFKEYYNNQDVINVINEVYLEDFELFNYDFL